MLICFSMDKWALHGQFYSYVDPVWSLYSIGPCCHVIVQVVFWVELPYKGDSARFSLNHGSQKRGHDGVVSGYSTFTSISRVDRLSTRPSVGVSHLIYVNICM